MKSDQPTSFAPTLTMTTDAEAIDCNRPTCGGSWLRVARPIRVTALPTSSTQRAFRENVVGHADWYGGNLRFAQERLVAAFDWDLVADVEPVVVGLNAGGYADTGAPAEATTPGEVAAFLIEYDQARPQPFDLVGQRLAAAAASWVVAYNARCRLSTLGPGVADATSLDMVQKNQDRFLQLTW